MEWAVLKKYISFLLAGVILALVTPILRCMIVFGMGQSLIHEVSRPHTIPLDE
jgi:hypothetical protein